MRFARRGRRRRVGRKRSLAARLLDIALTLAILGLLALLIARGFIGEPEVTAGAARVADGDSLVIGGERIRLEGIDAPELGQSCVRDGAEWPCGRQARDRLAQLTRGNTVSCQAYGRDRYDRLLARCTAAGVDLAGVMVEEGWAVAYGDYEIVETEARRAGRGIWSGSFERPQDWRHVHGGLAEDVHGGFVAWLRDIWRGWTSE